MQYLKIFVEFADWMEKLSREERGDLFMAMLRYVRDGEEPALTGNAEVLWPVARTQLDRTREQYEKTCAVNAANARKKSGSRAAAPGEKDAAPVGEEPAPAGESAAPAEEEPAPAGGEMLPIAWEEGPAGRQEWIPPAVVAVLPLSGGGQFPVYARKVEEWRRKYPGVDVSGELVKMGDWLRLHPERQRRSGEMVPFILRWLEKKGKGREKGGGSASIYAALFEDCGTG